ncbi:SDR family NAD(P)-dependent oxidoreductase [Pullulanibacillus sp. KACC 23026]|uniref:SDR family NAD(P)-dependent oxidoreductase n=1 Tax=Pullulanibacillus sp. KACC 23026 TaxID=3028315 RepID=UPI0023B1D29A|nr:SDR family NAD(P)-dependent oxidoreductase [Pullulanibacillus sp. KACC 23026]WEG10753.1 SDR family NAD(P)-dependent oxidoreductase [Pullulanibacillus sp. KACC 23026]
MDLSGQVAIITGGNKGIGKEIAEAFGKRGAKLVLAARNELELIETTKGFKDWGYDALPLVVDVTNPDQVKKMVEETIHTFHKIDVLVNNAGAPGPTKSAEDVTEEEWMQVINSNLTGSFLCIKNVLPYMKNQKKGRIINLSSISAKRPLIYRVGYSAAKMGVIGMTRTLAAELEQDHL